MLSMEQRASANAKFTNHFELYENWNHAYESRPAVPDLSRQLSLNRLKVIIITTHLTSEVPQSNNVETLL